MIWSFKIYFGTGNCCQIDILDWEKYFQLKGRSENDYGPEAEQAMQIIMPIVEDPKLPMMPHDSALHFIATERELIETGTPFRQPSGVDWERVQPDQYENIPFLKELRSRLSS